MSQFNFSSPGVQFAEKEIPSNTVQTISLTTLGLIGETPKGPAFQPIAVNKSDFSTVFGGLNNERLGDNLRYPLNYYGDAFLKEGEKMYVTRVLGLSGYAAGKAWTITGTVGSNPANTVLAVLRSRATYTGTGTTPVRKVAAMPTLSFENGNGKCTATITPVTGSAVNVSFSLDPDASDFITRVFGVTNTDKPNQLVYVDTVFTDFLRSGVLTTVTGFKLITNPDLSNYATGFKSPETPWVVSQLRGLGIEKLYKFISISDGDSANKEIKISHENIDPITKEFDVVIRDYKDTDDNPVVLERYTRCTMNHSLPSYIGRRMGCRTESNIDWVYALKSKYVVTVISDEATDDAFPCGFQGYELPSGFTSATSGLVMSQPVIKYKSSYLATDKIGRTYLGISERAYDSPSSKGKGLNDDLFKYFGEATVTVTPGFHLDSNAANITGTYTYVAGPAPLSGSNDIALATAMTDSPYVNKSARKFTMVPAGGFDGWDIYRTTRTNTSDFSSAPNAFYASDFNAWGAAIASFDNREETPINLLVTPGLDWRNHMPLINATLELVERVRKDCLYIIDAPNEINLGVKEAVDLFDEVGIDSSYAATYFPPIQIEDKANSTLLYIPASGEVARAMALTDKLKFPWYATGGTTRGLIPAAKRTRIKLRETDRDALYLGRINPIANFHDVGVDIFGQKTTQRKDSALDRINVRRLMLYAKNIIEQICKGLLFEQNDEQVASEFMKKANPVFTNIQRERGLSLFKIEQGDGSPEAAGRNELLFSIKLIPTSSVEFIGITFQINPQGAVFND